MNTVAWQSAASLLLQLRFNGKVLSTGTGFCVETPIGPCLITNRHNVTGRDQNTNETLSKTKGIPNEVVINHVEDDEQPPNEIAINHVAHEAPLSWTARVESLYHDEEMTKPRWYEHPTLGPRADFVALPLTSVHGIKLFRYKPRKPQSTIVFAAGEEHPIAISPAEPVSVIGFPFGLTAGGLLAIWATGFVASEPDADFNDLPVLLIDCRSRKGQSGSPVIAYRAGGSANLEGGGGFSVGGGPMYRFVGIYSGRVHAESDLGMVWKASAIAELIDSLQRPTLFKYDVRLT